jgi:hypothetical protein
MAIQCNGGMDFLLQLYLKKDDVIEENKARRFIRLSYNKIGQTGHQIEAL